MTGDCHVRFCESRGVKFPPATCLWNLRIEGWRLRTALGSVAVRYLFDRSFECREARFMALPPEAALLE